ncbi:MAG: HAMP domain-containing histidine kinase [Oscillospiraceae bacterium]|nr:HAMP domain-containing histidine kinase [Oscillospiraceae bacterium]
MRSIRLQFFSIIIAILLILLVLLNSYPLVSSRDLVFQEKERGMLSQAAVLSSSLSGLDSLGRGGVEEVLRLMDVSGFGRIAVADGEGNLVYDSAGGDVPAELLRALDGKAVFRSDFDESAFLSACAVPFTTQNGQGAALYLLERDWERAELIMTVQGRIRVASLAIAVLAIVLVLGFSELLLSRIRELVKSMRVVAGGDYEHRLKVKGRDEIAELGDEFNTLTERLDETEKQRRRFVSDASHELKTPLASIRLLADSVVQNDNVDMATVREFVSDISSEARRLQRTTEELLDLSRLDDGVQRLAEPVDLKQVALDALVPLRPLAAERQVHLHPALSEGCVIMANTDDMFHVVFNLLENAVKYNVPEGSVWIRLEGDEKNVVLTVSDSGIGIPEEDRLNIFSRFYRVDKARSRASGGTGLGLSIVHDAVMAHGGSIAVGANKPQGSVFVVTFPRPGEDETGI